MKRLSQEQVMYKHLEDHLEEWVSQTALDEAVFSAHGRRCGDGPGRVLRKLRTYMPVELDPVTGMWRLRDEEPVSRNGDEVAVSKRLRQAIFARDGSYCQLCGRGAGKPNVDGKPTTLHVDHYRPRIRGGRTIPTNLWTLCHVCNHDKQGTLLPKMLFHCRECGTPTRYPSKFCGGIHCSAMVRDQYGCELGTHFATVPLKPMLFRCRRCGEPTSFESRLCGGTGCQQPMLDKFERDVFLTEGERDAESEPL